MGEGPSKATTYSPWKQTPKPGSQDKPLAHEWSEAISMVKTSHQLHVGRGGSGEKSLGSYLGDPEGVYETESNKNTCRISELSKVAGCKINK